MEYIWRSLGVKFYSYLDAALTVYVFAVTDDSFRRSTLVTNLVPYGLVNVFCF